MGLTSWKGSIVRKGDVIIAKNYLNENEIDTLNRLVTLFLEAAELRVKERKDLTLGFWRNNVNGLLSFQGKPILMDKGSVTAYESEAFAKGVYEQFDAERKRIAALEADTEDNRFLEDLERKIGEIEE